ncbi:reverse transcriptase domain-containing protein [Tanacetum coccineum]
MPQIQGVSKTDFENYVKANDAVLKNVQNQGQNLQNQMANVTSLLTSLCDNFKRSASTSNPGTLPSQTMTNPRQQINAITTRSGKTLEEPSIPTPDVSNPQNEPNLETSKEKVQNPNLENTAHVPPPGEEDSIFIEILNLKAKKTVNVEIQDLNSPRPNSYHSRLPYPERMKVREHDKPSAQYSRFLKMFKQLCLEIGLKDALVEMTKFNKWLSSLLRNKEKLKEIAIMTVNAECSSIIINKVPEKLEDPGKFLIPCALQELNRTSALADSGASINLLPHSIYKKLELEALTPTRMTLELANRSISHPMGIAEDVVVRVDGFTFLADFVVVNFEPDPRVPIILGRPFLRTAKALIDLYEEKLTLRVGKDELVYYADKSEKNKEKNFVHAISVIDFSKDDPFSGSTTTHSDDPSPSSSPVKTSDNFVKFADELAPLDSLPPGNDDSTLKKDLHEENFQEDVEIKNSNVSDKLVFLNTPLSDKDECFAPEDDNDEIDDFLAIEVSSNLEEGYFDSEGDIAFLDNLLSDDDSHNLDSKVTSDHEPEQNESSITFSPRSDPLHHEFAGEPLTLPARNDREFEEYLSLMTVLNEISTSQGNFHQNSVNESLPISPIPVEDSEPTQEEIDILLVPDDLIPPGVEDADSEDEVNESPNLDHQDDPSIPRPPPEPPDIEKLFYPPKLPYPERMKVREHDKPSAQHSRFLKMFKQLRLEIGLKDALVEMPKFNKWLSSLLRNKEKLEEIAITTVNAECSAIIMNKVPEKLEDPGKFLIPCALQELNRTSALADSGASINLLPHSIYKKLELKALTPTRMTLELANRSITHPMGIAEDVVVRVDGFTFLADFMVVNFEPDPRVPIILGRPFLRTAKALIDLYEEKLTLRVGKDELVYYADKSEKNKENNFVHAISIIDFSKDDPFSGSTTTHFDDPSPSSSPVKTSDNFEEFADELAPLDSLPPGNDDSTLKKDLHEERLGRSLVQENLC